MLTKEQLKEQLDIIDRTNTHKNVTSTRVVPEDYTAFQKQVSQEELTLESPSTGVPFRAVLTKALDRTDHCPLFINFHGGGFVHPQDNDDDLFCAHVAARIHGIVLDVDYAVTPDYCFPAPFEQSWDAAVWAFDKAAELGADPAQISIGGHSAGGALSAAICMRAAWMGNMKFALQVLDYAALDNYMPFLSGGLERSRAFSTLYCGGNIRLLKSPFCSPSFATDEMLKNQPRTLVINAGNCPFRETDELYGRRLAAAGNEVSFRTFTESSHGFTVRLNGQWRQAQEEIIHAILTAGAKEEYHD